MAHSKTFITRRSGLTRRTFLSATAIGTSMLAAPFIKLSKANERKITVRDPGGPFTAGFGQAFYEPFEKETGIKVVGVQSGHEPTGMIKAMIEAENYTWDGAHLSKASHQSLVNIGYLEPITPQRSEERRVGKECRSRWSPYH